MIGQNIPAPPAAAGIGGSTGSVDNAVPRADGTGGFTVQGSDIVIDDATTSTANNVAIVNNHVGQTNSSLVLTPKGTGALIAGPKPDGTATGGNARGSRAVDLQRLRGAATQVASGSESVICGGQRNTSSGVDSAVVGGYQNNNGVNWGFIGGGYDNATQTNEGAAICAGYYNRASGLTSFIGGGGSSQGAGNTANARDSAILGGAGGLADRFAMQSHSAGRFAANGDAQRARFVMRNTTTGTTTAELFLDGSSTRLTIPSGKVMAFTINICGIRNGGADVAHYIRQYALKNIAGTTTEVYAPVTIGTDTATGTTIALSANDTNDALRVEVTGVTGQTWRWVAAIDAVEITAG